MHQAGSQFTFRAATAPVTASVTLQLNRWSSRVTLSQVAERRLYSDGVCRFSRVIASVQLVEV